MVKRIIANNKSYSLASKERMLVPLCVCLSLLPSFVRGGGGGSNLTAMEEDTELETQLKLLNKPALKTITTEDGDIYDCVDIYKQRAFDHPSLKNHTLQLKPTSYPIGMFDENPLDNYTIEVGGLRGELCPPRTVPTRRIGREDLIRMGMSLNHQKFSLSSSHSSSNKESKIAQFATLGTGSQDYYGASSYINVHGLPQITKRQATHSVFYVRKQTPSGISSIIAGWGVNPEFYGDSKTRLATAWMIEQNDKPKYKGCLDTICPGFVHVSHQMPLGAVIHPLSAYNGKQYVVYVSIFKDPTTTNWWLVFGKDKITIGYWPSEIFPDVYNWADQLVYGGTAEYFPYEKKPPMGSGHFSSEGLKRACFFNKIQYIDEKYEIQNIRLNEVSTYASRRECYSIGKYFNGGGNWGNMFYFGGPGNCKN